MDIHTIRGRGDYSRFLLVSGVLILAAAASLPMLSVQTLSNHECFVSITSREMLHSGNWVVPTCNGEPRLQKTPLSYWLVAGISNMTGGVDELTTRLPSAISGILSAAAILYFVSRWLSLRAAALSAAVWVTMLSFIRYSRNGRPEMLMSFFAVVSFLSFYSAITEENRSRQIAYSLVFWVSFALGNLAKGPAPIAYVGVPLFFYVLVFKQWKQVPRLLPIAGPLIFLAIVLPWPLAIASKFNWHMDIWKKEFFDRFFGEYDPGHKPTYFYFYVMFIFAIPWVAFLPMALAAPFFKAWREKSGPMWFCWIWFAADLAFITVDGGKRQHYILPMMPAAAILIGIILEDMAFVHKAYSLKQAKGILRNHIVVIAAGVSGGAVYAGRAYSGFRGGIIVVAAVAVVAAAVIGVLFARRRTTAGLATVFVSIIVVTVVSYRAFFNPLDRERNSRDFSTQLAEIVPPSGEMVGYKFVSKRTVQYFGRVVPEVKDKSQLYDDYEQGDWVLATGKFLKELNDDGRFRMIYYRDKAELFQQDYMSGALFHKSAPVVSEQGDLQAASTLSGR